MKSPGQSPRRAPAGDSAMSLAPLAWRDADGPEPLADRQVHLYRVFLTPGDDPRLLALLSMDERDRAQRIRLPVARARFITARAVLRKLVAAYLGERPEGIVFNYGERGKPLVQPRSGLEFNLAHSGELALLAFTRTAPVGVDLEHQRPALRYEAIARRFFSVRERDALLRLPAAERRAAFLRYWVVKEAFLKAKGTGLYTPLRDFDVDLGPGASARICAARLPGETTHRWSARILCPCPGYVAAVVLARPGWTLTGYQWGRRPPRG